MTRFARLRAFVLSVAALAPAYVVASEPAYVVENVPLAVGMSPELSAVTFSPSGRMFVANRHGDVWSMLPEEGKWTRFAHGFHEPLGLIAVSDQEVYVAHKPELTRLVDEDGDLQADAYETVADDWPTTDNWHEHAFGLARDKDGAFVMALGLCDVAGPINTLWPRTPLDFSKVGDESKLSLGRGQGCVIKITPQGETTLWAYGFREACGVAVSPEGEIFITDQQGDYIASSPLTHIEEGKFYGHPASAKWMPGFEGKPLTDEQLAAMRTPETVILPHGSMGGSPGEPVWDVTNGRFGPFGGQVFIGDFTKLISRVDLEKVDGQYQGACFTFLRDVVGREAALASSGRSNLTIPAGAEGEKYFREGQPIQGAALRQGNMRMAFAPDGSLYVAQTTRGWAFGDGLQRIVWTGRTPVEIATLRLTDRGFRLKWTVPMDPEPALDTKNYSLTRFRYPYHRHYGSPRLEENEIGVSTIKPNQRGDEFELVLEALEPGYIYSLEIENQTSVDGEPAAHPHAYYTLNRTLDGRRFEGSITSGSRPLETAEAPRPPNPRLGMRVYNTFCVQCHREDGKGSTLPGGAADFTKANGALTKSDEELVSRIARGIEGKTMPPFGYVLSQQQIHDVLAYLRQEFETGGN